MPARSDPNEMKKSTLERDLTAFQDFIRQWNESTLSEDNPVVVKTSHWTKLLAFRYGYPDRADDLRQEALMRLATSEYRGQTALDTYILAIVRRLNIAAWRLGGGKRRDELPAEMTDEESPELFEKALRTVEEDEFVTRLLATRSVLRRLIVEIILDAEKQVSIRRMAESASQKLGYKVTRHEVQNVLKELREELKRHPGRPEATTRRSVTELRGRGKALWRGVDAQEYINSERGTWDS